MNHIGIIGDVHAEHERLESVLSYFAEANVDAIICTGDLPDGRGDLEHCCGLLKAADAHAVAGNHDRWFLQDKVRHVEGAHLRKQTSPSTLRFLESLPKTLSLETDGGVLILCHGVLENDLAKVWPGSEKTNCRMSDDLDDVLGQEDPPRYIVNGHMHFRTVIDFPRTQVINAGTLKGQFAGFCLLDAEQQYLESFNFAADGTVKFVKSFDLALDLERRVWQSTQEFNGEWEPVVLHKT